MSYGIDVDNGPSNAMYVRHAGVATIQLQPVLDASEPPLRFGRISASDTVELASGKRRMYAAVTYAFNTPDWEAVSLGVSGRRGRLQLVNCVCVGGGGIGPHGVTRGGRELCGLVCAMFVIGEGWSVVFIRVTS